MKLKFSLSTPRRHKGRVQVWIHSFLTLVLDGGEWLTSRPGRFTLGEERRHPLNTRLAGPRSGPDVFGVEKNVLHLPGFEPRTIQPIV
jgi:hypothetical protein